MSRQELAAFVDRFADNLVEEPESWENDNLEDFLRALSAWLYDMDGCFTNFGEPVPEAPTWQLIARMLKAASAYE